jgi:acyl-CoA dehydrogenase
MIDEMQGLLDSARRVFEAHCDAQLLQSFSDGNWAGSLWNDIVEIGLTAAMVSEENGGVGLTPVQALPLLMLAGEYAVPVPLAETMLAAWLLDQAGLPVPEGPLTVFGIPDGNRLLVNREGGLTRVTGTAQFVPWARHAKAVVLVVDGPQGPELLVMQRADAQWIEESANVADEPRDTMDWNGESPVHCGASRLDTGQLQSLGAVIRATQMAGACARALALAADYANLRVQFGRPIAKFQVIQHNLAVLATHVAAAKAAADRGIESASGDLELIAVASAKIRTGEAAGAVAGIAHQVFGAIGFTKEHPLHFTTRRLWAWRDEFGNETFWAGKLGKAVARNPGSQLWAALTS